MELKDKMLKLTDDSTSITDSVDNTLRGEALSALANLGFNKAQAERAIDKSLASSGDGASVEDLIKEALKNM